MQIPDTAIIPSEKLTHYLLAPRPWDDKSKFLAQVGFRRDQPKALEDAIRKMISTCDAVEDGANPYGTFYRVEGSLLSPSGDSLQVIQIWLQWNIDGTFHFVTLKPSKVSR